MKIGYFYVLLAIAAGIGGWFYLERTAVADMMARHSGATAERQAPSLTTRPRPAIVNRACRELCEPHCRERWGDGAMTYLPREGCFRNCIDVACRIAK